ncbi:MAG: alanine--tRNA ligase [Candidatus Omnitrophota bacterium]
MQSFEVRQKFLDFFAGKGHTVVPGIPLVPPEDPTLLFTSAGMVPFKNFWAGSGELPYLRAASVQKCLRAGGKDSDLENVGYDTRHHTFFEMLGNFSFGDYFKEGAIDFAWEFVMEYLHFPEENLWVSVYEKDEEAFALWKKFLPANKIVRLGEKDNFWGPAGETGVCGPCSEIYFDRGRKFSCGKTGCAPGCDCERYLEFWNLVFPQFNKTRDGTFLPLARKGIDTGMGLERVTSLSEGKESDFETDLFLPVIRRLEELTGCRYGKDEAGTIAFRVVADHIRLLTFAIAEHILPANEGRGYVIRRILRRAVKFLRTLTKDEVELSHLVPEAVRIMSPYYTYLVQEEKFVQETVADEEERFLSLLTEGHRLFHQFSSEFARGTVPGKTAFQLYDTYGLPLDTIKEIAAEDNLKVDQAGFEEELTRARTASRKAMTLELDIDRSLLAGLPPTKFVGYETIRLDSEVLAVIPLDKEQYSLVLTETPFYPERGGQKGDRGLIKADGFEFEAAETRIDETGFIHHLGKFRKGEAEKGSKATGGRATLEVDYQHRQQTAANHTATHLLHSALRQVLGKEVKQAGSLVAPESLRFDFLYSGEIRMESLDRVEELVNETIGRNIPVIKEEKVLREAVEEGATALFTEKYGEQVRVITVGDFSKEVCGGTHLDATGNIGLFIITGVSSIGKGIKRVEALTGKNAYLWMKKHLGILSNLAERLKTEPLSVIAELERREKEEQKTKRKLSAFLLVYLNQEKEKGLKNKKVIAGFSLLASSQPFLVPEEARLLVDELKKGSVRSVILVLLPGEGRSLLFLGLTRDLVTEGFKANEILREITPAFGGGAGGREDFAQAGLKKVGSLAEIEKVLVKWLLNNKYLEKR